MPMGYRGKVHEQQRARELRAGGSPLAAIAAELGVSKSSVSVWVRDVVAPPRAAAARGARPPRPNRLRDAKEAEIIALRAEGVRRMADPSERDLLVAGVALYAGEGAKADRRVVFVNSDSRMMALFMEWLRRFFEIDETRLRGRLYLHEGLDLDEALRHWAAVTDVPGNQFLKPYRAKADATIRHTKHPLGCATISYSCSRTQRMIKGLMEGLLSWPDLPG